MSPYVQHLRAYWTFPYPLQFRNSVAFMPALYAVPERYSELSFKHMQTSLMGCNIKIINILNLIFLQFIHFRQTILLSFSLQSFKKSFYINSGIYLWNTLYICISSIVSQEVSLFTHNFIPKT